MNTVVNWANPYAERDGRWYKGNLHTHTSPASGCGHVPVDAVLAQYAASGYDFLALSDHMKLTEADHDRLILIPGVEWNDEGGRHHMCLFSLNKDLLRWAIGTPDQNAVIERLAADGALVILNHPNWQLTPHYRREELLSRSGYDGIEIYNGVIEWLDGEATATDKWDYLLANGRRVLGYATDDYHAENHLGFGCTIVRATEPTPTALLRSLKQGNFYSSKGVTFTDIRREGNEVIAESDDAEEMRVIFPGGHVAAGTADRTLRFDLSPLPALGPDPYVRIAAYGCGAAMAWTQPFYLTSGSLSS